MPSDLERAISGFQSQVVARDQKTASDLTTFYARSYRRIERERQALEDSIVAAQRAGTEITPAWFFQSDRLEELQRQMAVEIGQFAQHADQVTKDGLKAVIGDAAEHARKTYGALGVKGTWADLNEGAIQALVGAGTGTASPLRGLFASLGPATADHVTQTIVTGLALGRNPVDVARSLRDVAQVPLYRAQTIARTEQLRAYREASRAAYRRNADLVDGWIWFSALDKRTCAACWAMHGTHHPLNEPMAAHPNCRCTMIPDVNGSTLRIQPGNEVFSNLPPEDQRTILGPGKYQLYEEGKISLEDAAHVHSDPRWGDSVGVANKRQALENAARRASVPPPPPPQRFVQTPPALPSGLPAVGDALDVPVGKKWDGVRNALDAIGKVHGDGQLPRIPMQEIRSKRRYGAYMFSQGGRAIKVEMNIAGADHLGTTTVHEVGHFLDHQGLGRPGSFFSEHYKYLSSSPEMPYPVHEMAELNKAIDNSEGIQTLRRLRKEGHPEGYVLNNTHITYLLGRVEKFARAYAQYIAVESGNPTLLAELAEEVQGTLYPKQWTEADFAPIRQAMTNLLKAKGWR